MWRKRRMGRQRAWIVWAAWVNAACCCIGISADERRPADVDVPITGCSTRAAPKLDDQMVAFVKKHDIPGAALAIGYRGKIVYSRGFGYADRGAKEPVAPDALFRIASISKPITAVAILRLVDQGRLRLDDPVLKYLPAEWKPPAGWKRDPRWERITIRHLLQHRGGWDRTRSIDCMFYPVEIANVIGTRPPAGPEEIIRFMQGWPLDFDPGERYAYSNFGYCLLGRVIERVTGMPYDEHVRSTLLKPLGNRRMRIGRTLESGRADGEVRYYSDRPKTAVCVFAEQLGRPVAPPYGAWHLEAMDAHGGWIASAPDLVRFGCAVEAAPGNGLLSDASKRAMLARPPGRAGKDGEGRLRPAYYGFGWTIRPPKTDDRPLAWWHTGSLPGTSTLLVVRADGWSWAVLFNTRDTPGGKRPAPLIDQALHRTIDSLRDTLKPTAQEAPGAE